MEIRRLDPEQWQAHRRVRLAALVDSPEAFGSTYATTLLMTEVEWRAWNPDHVWIAWAGGQPVGMVRLCLDEDMPELISLWVDPEVRGEGVARRLIEAAMEGARTYSPRLKLCVYASNHGAARLYERLGFVRTGELIEDESGRVEIVMVATLDG